MKTRHPGIHRDGPTPVRRALPVLAIVAVLAHGLAAAGVKYGDAVPGVIHPSDFERIKLTLRLDRFSIIAAVRLGAAEGREVIIAEPLSDETLKRVKDACEAGGFCPDPVGFVASRVHIVLLQDRDVETMVTVQREPRGARGRLVDLRALGVEGEILGWNGRAEASDGHVALSLTPVTAAGEGGVAAGLNPPLLLRYNAKASRFQVFDCVAGDAGGTICDFLEEPGD